MMTRVIFFLLFIILVDLYTYWGIVGWTKNTKRWLKYLIITFFLISIITVLVLMLVVFIEPRTPKGGITPHIYKFMGAFILFYVPKLFLVIFLLIEDVYRFINIILKKIKKKDEQISISERRSFLAKTAVVVASIPFIGVLDGLFRGRFDFRVHHITIRNQDLPSAFEGFTIAQISDVHAQSFNNSTGLEKAIQILKSLKADMVVLTGDLVNNFAHEIDPIINQIQGIKAEFGTYAVLGNHDYGLYSQWENENDKIDNQNKIRENYNKIGFKLLNNEAVKISKEDKDLYLIGVENWGLKPFPQYGDLDKALTNVPSDSFKILLSHDPTHWKEKVIPHKEKIHLTLSGHTHGMQFGIEIPGFRWSPIKYKYENWAGLYAGNEEEQLYVNRGLGCIGFPGRVGIWPEITLFTLANN